MTSFRSLLIAVGGTLLVIASAIFAGIFDHIFNSTLHKMMVIKKESKIFSLFEKPPYPIHMEFHFFNVTNPLEVQYYGAKPILNEVGPYSYHEYIERYNFNWHNDGTVQYFEKRSYRFEEERSVGTPEDKITLINIIMVVAASLGYDDILFRELIWPQIESEMDLFERRTVSELLFDGWDLPIFDFDFSHISDNFGLNITANLTGSLYDILVKVTGKGPSFLKENKFGFYYGKNGSIYGDFRVKTGEESIQNYLDIESFNNISKLSFWSDQYCDMINGTDGTQFAPDVSRNKVLRIFNMDLCRSIYLTYEKDVKIKNLIDAYRFIVPKEVLESPKNNLDNACFCIKLPGDDECLGDGLLNIAPCFKGAPIVLSTPHFYQGDPKCVEALEGLKPNKLDHETFADVEPTSGVVISAAKRIQLNAPLKPYAYLPSFRSVQSAIFPILWADENTNITDNIATKANKALTMPFAVAYSVSGIVLAIGLVLASIGSFKYFNEKKARKFG